MVPVRPVKVAVDAMGGDVGVSVTVPAAAKFAIANPRHEVILVGNEHRIISSFDGLAQIPNLSVRHASDEIMMNERPTLALRNKRSSSMAIALQMVSDGQADVCLSAGNTGALMALSRSLLRMLPGIERPALLKVLPSTLRRTYVLDLGANIDCSAEHLYQFALLGCAYCRLVEGNSKPRVALLNVGEEDIKGTEPVRLAARLIAETPGLSYVGFIEGNQLFSNKADVVVCDGFVGNVALKTGEGVARMLLRLLDEAFKEGWYARLLGLLAQPVLSRFVRRINPGLYNGAILIGVQGLVFKSHGAATESEFYSAISQATREGGRVAMDELNQYLDDILI